MGEAPGISEDVAGVPFKGPAGKLLDRIIAQAAAKSREFTWAMTNVVACLPTDDETGSKTSEPPPEAVKKCAPRLREFIVMARPRIAVLVGAVAKRGFPKIAGLRTLVITHPAAILRANNEMVAQSAMRQCIVQISSVVRGLDK